MAWNAKNTHFFFSSEQLLPQTSPESDGPRAWSIWIISAQAVHFPARADTPRTGPALRHSVAHPPSRKKIKKIKVEIEDDFVEIELDTWLATKDAWDKISENLVNYDGKDNISESDPKGAVNMDDSL